MTEGISGILPEHKGKINVIYVCHVIQYISDYICAILEHVVVVVNNVKVI